MVVTVGRSVCQGEEVGDIWGKISAKGGVGDSEKKFVPRGKSLKC